MPPDLLDRPGLRIEEAASLFGPSTAVFSADGQYRYLLTRSWPEGDKPPLVLVMLNPSKAGAVINDHTVRRGIGFARREGCRGLVVGNLNALVATDPAKLRTHPDPVGEYNDEFIARYCGDPASTVVAGWGMDGRLNDRDVHVTRMLTAAGVQLWCLGRNKDGSPCHPLYLSKTQPLLPFGGDQ